MVSPRIELGLQDSKSWVLPITPQDQLESKAIYKLHILFINESHKHNKFARVIYYLII